MPYATVNQTSLYYEIHGQGAPVLMIAGLGSDAGTWSTVIPALQDRYMLIVFENRGSGRSSKLSESYSTELFCEDAIALLDHLGVERPHVIGKSMGGMIAQIMAARFPQRVRSLVLACTLMKHDGYGEELLELGRIVAEKAGLYETNRLAFLLSYSNEYCITNRARLEEAKRLLERTIPEEMLRGYLGQSLACQNHDSRALVSRIEAPTLILSGPEDRITPPSESRLLADAIPGSILRIVPRGGHGFWREFPEDTNPIVREFLDQH